MSVVVLDRDGKALMSCTEARSSALLERGRARILPSFIRLIDSQADSCKFQPLEVKIDPGSKFTGTCVYRLAVPASSNFTIQPSNGLVQGISCKNFKVVPCPGGHGYQLVAKKGRDRYATKARSAMHSALYLPGMKADISRAIL